MRWFAVPVTGKTIRVNTAIEKGMNLDYDGDTLQVHVPVTTDAVHDAKNMTMTNLLLSDQQRNRRADRKDCKRGSDRRADPEPQDDRERENRRGDRDRRHRRRAQQHLTARPDPQKR